MLKSELQGLLDRVNNLSGDAVENIKEYVLLVKLAVDKLSVIQQEDKSPMLDAWLSMGLQELRNELSGRLANIESFTGAKLKTEFMYSKSVTSMSLTNILMHF
jgi:hypothetical protein